MNLTEVHFGCNGSPFFMGERIAKNESGKSEKQIYLDLPRTEPRRIEDAENSEPPDFKDPDAIRDGAVAADEDRKLNGIVFMRPFLEGASLPFTITAESSALKLCPKAGCLECRFEDPETLRIRGSGTGLRFYAPLPDHEAAVDRQDGTYQLCIEASCEFLFIPMKGTAVMDNPWELMHGGTRKLLLTFLPDKDGILELAVRMASSSCEQKNGYLPFEECSAGLFRDASADPERIVIFLPQSSLSPAMPEYEAEEATAIPDENAGPSVKELWTRPILPRSGNGKLLLSSTGKYDLRSVQFSRRGSFICIPENDEDRCLYLSVTRSPEMWAQRLHLIRTAPVLGNTELPYEYDVTPGMLTVRTCAGFIDYCFDGDGRLHIRGDRIVLRLEADLLPGESCVPGENGVWKASFDTVGNLFFIPVRGVLRYRTCTADGRSLKNGFILECVPDGNSVFETVIENGTGSIPPAARYMSFEDCVKDAEKDFESFAGRFPQLPEAFRDQAGLAAWVIWIHTLGPSGLLRNPVVYMTRSQWVRAFSWQQSFHAMAACRDIREAWKLLLTVFDYADRCGQLPDSISDIGGTWRVTKPALQGLAILCLTEKHSLSGLPVEAVSDLYTRLSRTARWWLSFRDRNNSGLPQYFHADESPGEFCSVFRKGVPLYAADIAAFVALTAEACGKLAGHLGKTDDEQDWFNVSHEIIRKMISMLWDGERFQARLVSTGEIVESRCILQFLPVMLGTRLPREILEKMLSRLTDEREYLTPSGLVVENLCDDTGDGIPMGTTVYLNTLFAVALKFAGEEAIARDIAGRALKLLTDRGFCFLDLREEASGDPGTYENMPRVKAPAPVSKWTSWLCACFFILADILTSAPDR